MTAAVIDAQAVGEFLDKAQPWLTEAVLADVGRSLESRARQAPRLMDRWTALWDLAPVGRRISPEERASWAPHLQEWLADLREGDAERVLARLDETAERPGWLVDWATFWLHVRDPANPWWARWVFRPDHQTGALLLVVDDALLVGRGTLTATYQEIQRLAEFLAAVLASTGRLRSVPEPHRVTVALASVYAVYLFTMAAWRMTDEFTEVLPPFPVVVKTLLGLTRWEGTRLGGQSEAH